MQGLCTGHENPDMWFSDSTELEGSGRPRKNLALEKLNDALEALAICKICPTQRECKAEGMKAENIDNGIWGGTMSGERLMLSLSNIRSMERVKKVDFAKRVRSVQEYSQ